MRRPSLKNCVNARAALALFAGLTLALAFPQPGWAGLAWIAPALMLLAALNAPPGRALRLGYLAGLTHNLVALHWLLFIPFPAGAAVGWLALSAYTALYPAAWVWLCGQLLPKPWPAPTSGWSFTQPLPSDTVRTRESHAASPASRGSFSQRLRQALAPVTSLAWTQRVRWSLACAAAWVALEIIRGWLLTGFPWNFLGVTQYRMLPLIQIASVTGVYGVSFLVVWGAMALFCTITRVAAQLLEPPAALAGGHAASRLAPPFGAIAPRSPWVSFRMALMADVALPLLVLLYLTFTAGFALVRRVPAGPELKVALVQPSIPQRLIFDPAEVTNRFAKLMDLTRAALATRPDLLVWPEASLPSFSEANFRALTNLVATRRVWIVFGADDEAERPATASGEIEFDQFNSAFLFDPAGEFAATYRKRRLVIFGEYVPFVKWLPFLRRLIPIGDGYTPGHAPGWFRMTRPAAVASVLICFEDMFPALARESVGPDTDFLLNLTNDGWFGESAEQWQHAAGAVFRAVENGLPLVCCANNGLTFWTDSLGRMHDVGFSGPDDVYRAGVKSVRIPLRPVDEPAPPTYYRRHGDVFGWSCVGLTVLMLAPAIARRRQFPLATRRPPA